MLTRFAGALTRVAPVARAVPMMVRLTSRTATARTVTARVAWLPAATSPTRKHRVRYLAREAWKVADRLDGDMRAEAVALASVLGAYGQMTPRS